MTDLGAWSDLVSSRVGIVREVAPQGRSSEEPVPPYLYTAMLSHFDFRQGEKSERIAAGKDAQKSSNVDGSKQ